MKKEAKSKNGSKTKKFPLKFDYLNKSMQKNNIAVALKSSLKYILIFALLLLLLPFAFADFWTNQPSHQTLYGDTITSKTDANPVTIADGQGLIVTTGNVGIGTTDPLYNLDIVGAGAKTLRVRSTDNQAKVIIDSANVAGKHPTLSFGIAGGEYAYIRMNTGTGDLELSAQPSATGDIVVMTDSDSYLVGSTALGGDLYIAGTNSGTVGDVFINPVGGNVGIGTTAPTQKLEVVKTTAVDQAPWTAATMTVRDDRAYALGVGGGIIFEGKYTSGGAYSTFGGIRGHKLDATDGGGTGHLGSLDIFARSGGVRIRGAEPTDIDSFTPHMIVDSTGSVGIGTTSPQTPLHIRSTATTTLQLENPATGTNAADNYIVFKNGDTSGFLLGIDSALGNDGFSIVQNAPPWTRWFHVSPSGNVGIGTTNPAEKLDLTGAMHITPQASPPAIANSGDLYVDSTPAADELCFYDGVSWQGISSGIDANCA